MIVSFNLNDVDVSHWKGDGEDGVWIALGFGHAHEGEKHYDMVMCEFKYAGTDGRREQIRCYDRYWDGEEFYKDDTY